MADKKSWRDYYNDSDSKGTKESGKKTASWRDYYDSAAVVGENVTGRLKEWLNSHNSYISDYQKRFAGRKGTYEDAYVSDSADWLNSTTERRTALDAEANSILAYLNQYGGHLDSKWVDKVRKTISSAKGTQYDILNIATKDNEWWNSFGSEEMLSEHGTAEEAYKYSQRADGYYKTYGGMTSDELSGVIGGMDDGEEKDWLASYRSSVDYDEKSKADLNVVAKEIEDMEEFYNTAYSAETWYAMYQMNPGAWTEEEVSRNMALYNTLKEKYGSIEDLDKLISDKKAYLDSAKYIQDLNSMSAVSGNDDFADKSKYISNVEYELFGKPKFTDDTYAYVNNPTVEDKRPLGGGDITARDLIESDHSTYSWDTPTRNSDSSYKRDALDHIKPEEVAIYNYYYATEGPEKAQEYLDLLVATFKDRRDAETVKGASKFASEHPWLSSAFSVGTSIGSGFEYLEDIIRYGGDKLMGKDAKLDTNELALTTNAIRGTVAEQVEWKIGNWDAFDFVYNTTMSGIDSLASTAFGNAGGVVLGLSAAAQGTNDALERGMSDGQAFWNGLFSGVFEGLFESLSIGNFNALKETAVKVGLKNIDKTVIKTIAKNIGKSMLVNASEEMLTEIANITYDTLVNGEFANYTLEELFEKGEWKQALNQVIESGASGALMGMGMSALGSSIGHKKGVKAANEYAVKNYGGQTDALIQEGLESDTKSNSYKLATKYQQQVQGKNGKQGKALTGQQIRNLLAANQEQITPKDMKKIQQAAEKRLTELGQTEDVSKLAEIATKWATGQEITRAEKSLLTHSKYGSRVANELLPDNIDSDNYSTAWTEEIGTQEVNAKQYNKKAIRTLLDAMASMEDASAYKSLESRMEGETPAEVSDTGKAVIRGTDTEVDLTAPTFKQISDEGVVLDVNGKDVRSNEIDYDSEDQGLAINAIGKIEHITPAAASALYAKLDMTKPVMAQLNGMDEAFTYGFYNYSEADLEAGTFAGSLTQEQKTDAYNLGRYVAKNGTTDNTAAIKKMRTAVDALAEKNAKEGKKAPKAKKLTITYNHGGGVVEDIATAEKKLNKLNKEQRGGIEAAKILHQMGIGTDYELFTSYYSKTLKDENGNPLEVFLNDEGQEEAAYAGVYMAADGKIRINLNAYSGTKGLTLNALSHELTHFIKTWSLEKYEAMAEFLVKSYGEKGVSMHKLVLKEQDRLGRIRGEEVSYGEAYDEVVANAFNRMLEDGKVMDRIAEIRQIDKSLGDKIIECIRNFIKRFTNVYQKNQSLFHETKALMEMKEVFDQLQNMFAEALVDASENFQASLIAKEAGLEVAPVEDSTQYSYQSLAEAAGFGAVENENGTRSFVRDGQAVSKVTVEDIENSPIGAFINFSLEMGDINEADAKRQKKMFADICTMACKTNDFAMTMQFVGSAVFTGMKANADKQYGTTYDFPSICTKTQAVIDAMSAKMVSLGRGLTTDEIVQLYDDVFASGNPVPCPECYVFSRWIGIGGLLDNIKKYQDYYGDMAVEDVADAYRKMKAEVSKFADEQGISFGKAKGALTSKLTKEFNKLNEKIEKAQNQGEKVKPADLKRLEELEPMMNTVKSMTWLENVYFADSSLKKVNPKFRVPDSVLFDLNNGEAFASQYKDAWAFRTTQGAGYGKAITPYAEARLGEGVLVTNNTTNAIKGKAQGSLDNYFLSQMGKLDKKSRDALKRARLKQKIQAFIGGQRFQSTSDARYENASDYLLAALEMQAMAGMVQCYTKVDGAVPAFSAWGFSINQSLMPLNGGLDADGNVQDTAVGGMKPSVAFENRKKHESAGTITIGVNDNHIRAMFKQLVRDFIIPYHASGGKADVVAAFRRIQEGKEAKGKAVRSTDYSRTQSDKILSDEVLRWQGKTDAQIQRIHEIRNARIAILTGGKVNMTVVRSNRFLSALYDKLNGGEWDGVKLAKSKVESQIFPNEFWDQTVTYEESAKITKDYLEYCEDLGFLHRFSGMIPSNGKLIPANGYNENGERVQLTDLAYKYDEKGNKTAEVEEFFWKVLTDRRMYDNNGNYLPQKVVTLNDTTTETVTGFAKNNQGREYDKAKAEALAKKIAGGQYSSQQTDLDSDGNELSKDQQKYFANSVVRDADGNLMVMYHGTANGGAFTVFDGDQLDNSSIKSQIGQGFYFTNVKKEAESYMQNMDIYGRASKGKNPNLHQVYLNITNPFDINADKLDLEKVKAVYMDGTSDHFFDSFISFYLNKKTVNGRVFTKSEVQAMSKADRVSLYVDYMAQIGTKELLSNMVQAFSYGKQSELLTSMQNRLGYDGIVEEYAPGKFQYVAFSSEQVKYVDNKKPTADKDIRYSSQQTDLDRIYIEYGDIASEKAAIDKTVARLVSEGKFVRIAADDVEKHKTSGEWDSRKGARQYLKRILKGFLGKSVRFNHNIVRAEAYLTKEGFNHSAVGLNTPEKAAAFSKYYALIANSEYSYSSKNDIHSNANIRIGGKIDWDSFVAVAMIEGDPYPVVFKVRTIDNDIRSQIYRMATKNEIGSTHDYGQQNYLPDALPNYGGTPISGDKISQTNPEVNKNPSKIAKVASDFVSHMNNIVNTKHGWYAKDVFKYVEEHPELGFIELIYAKDKDAKKLLEKFLSGIDDLEVLHKLSWYMGEAYGDKGRTWTWDDGATYPYRGAVRTFRNAIKKRENAIMTEKVGGTNLGIKNGEVTLADVKELYSKLNSNEEMKEFAEKVFATCEKLGVSIRFVNQTLSKQRVAGDNLGDMVEYKTSYFNDTAVTDQRKANTILHELIHACTVYVMEANKFRGDVSWSNKSDNYNRIANAAQRLNRIYGEIEYDSDFKGQYGLKNAKEMAAELANPEFVGLMKKKSLWDSIVDWICDLFGFRRGNSAYDNARLCLDYILDNPEVSEYKAFANTQRENARYNGMDVFGQTRYSTQQTDNITDRDMLANAFETISKSSDEYEMIQDYKSNVERLNKLERELDEVNQEIRKIRFVKGEYNKEKLKVLEGKADRLAKSITKYDKMLLNMEASAPLRRVIQRERKKEAQRTKDHVKEIQQNKKVRAEQTELRHKIRKTIRDLDKILNRGNKKLNVKEDMKGFASKALELADYLFTDHISNDDLIRKGITVRMTPKEAALVKETEDILSKLYDNADSLTDEEFTQLDAKRKANEDKLRALLTAQRNERLNTPVYNLFNDLVTEYAKLQNSKQDAVRAAYNVDLERLLRQFMGDTTDNTDTDRKTLLQNMRVADMTTAELQKLLEAYKMVLTNVRDANKVFAKSSAASIEEIANKVTSDFYNRKTPDGKVATVIRNLSNKLGWDYEKLHYALDRIGSEAFTELVMNIADSENIVMQDIMEAVAFRDEMIEKYGFNNWAVNKEIDREFMDNTGKKFKLTLGQLMALYAYSRREGAWDHIEYGGFVFGEAALTNPRPADSYKLTKDQCEAITGLLTKEQKGYAEDMQKYLSETMGEKGNDVSMLLYGIKMFGEKNYFPIHVAGQFKAQANESQAKAAAGFSSMSNAGFTHAQNPNAKAPFVLEGFNEIWADHVNEMSRYHGTVPALEDMRRVMNRSSYSESTADSMAIKQLMENSYGKEAVEYFNNLYREANSGAITDKLQKKSKKLLSLFRKNSVAYSLSVLVQQPASMVRAYAMIDRKYFGFKGFGALTSGIAKAVSDRWTKAHTNAYNEMLKYAPGVTMAKEIGGFDTHTGGSIRSYLLDTNKKFSQKWKTGTALEKGMAVLDAVDNNAIANLPNLADKIAWVEIWNACKREALLTHKDLAPNSEEFMQAVGERFTEVIRATQVYDSMFAKSPMLKSKNLAVQYLVSFMNEPNTIANMAEKAVRDATKGDWKGGLKTAVVVVHSIIFTNVLKSIIYAMRDDDEDETYIEKYIEAVTGNMMDDFNPLNYIPIARDVWSIAQGYDVERADMAIVADAIGALNNVIKNAATQTDDMTEEQLVEFDKKVTEANWQLAEAVAALFGIPVKNIRREIDGVLDHARIAHANAGQTTAQSAWDKVYDAVIDSIPFMQVKATKGDKLYEAIIGGDQAYIDRLKSTYKDEDAYQSAVRKALRENDPRIHAAAQARIDGNSEEYKRIFREIQGEGKFSFDDIMSAINSEESKIRNKTEPDKVISDYTASGYVEAIVMGNMSGAEAMKEDIIATKMANGKTQAEAEKEFISSVTAGIRDKFHAGLLDEAGAKNLLLEYADKDEEEAASKVSHWSFCDENPQYDYFTESNVEDYREFAEPENISLEVYAQFINGTKGLADIKDEWGDVEVTKREQVLEVIDSLPLTWQQKDALYLAYGYAESKIWDVPW